MKIYVIEAGIQDEQSGEIINGTIKTLYVREDDIVNRKNRHGKLIFNGTNIENVFESICYFEFGRTFIKLIETKEI